MRARLLIPLVAAAVLGGCGGAPSHPRSGRPARPAAFDGCISSGPKARLVRIAAPAERLPAVVLGDAGPIGVVMANESGGTACDWLPYAHRLSVRGARVLLFDYGSAAKADEIAAGARWLRAHGARRIVLVGAERGADAAVSAAARGRIVADAVAALSAGPVAVPLARRLHVGALWVGRGPDVAALERAARGHASPDLRVIVSSGPPGTALVADHEVRDSLTQFVLGAL